MNLSEFIFSLRPRLHGSETTYGARFSERLDVRLIALILLLVAISLASTSAMAYFNGRTAIEGIIFDHLSSINLLKASELDLWYEKNEKMLELLAAQPLIQEKTALLAACTRNSGDCRALKSELLLSLLNVINNRNPDIEALTIIQASDGTVLVSTEADLDGVNLSLEELFIKGKIGTHTTSFKSSESRAGGVMHIATPIYNPKGSLIAVLSAQPNLEEMSTIVNQLNELNESEDTYLVNADQVFLTNPRFGTDFALAVENYTSGVERCLAEKSTGTDYYTDYRGIPVIGSFTWLGEKNLCILTKIDEAEAYAPIRELRIKIILLSLSVFFIATLLGFFSSRQLVLPVRRLTKAINQVTEGNLGVQVPVNGRDELNRLAQSFNQMIHHLKLTMDENVRLVEEIKDFNASLESQVRQRTSELNQQRIAVLNMMNDLQQEMLVRKQAEREVADKAQELERSNLELQQFAYVASHDLQEPLRMVTSYLQLLERRYGDLFDGDAREFMDFAVNGADRMKTLINNLLDYSRVNTSGGEFAETDLNAVLGRVRVNLGTIIEETRSVVSHDELPTVKVDESQVTRLLQNLISNAIKFRGKDIPRVHISAKRTDQGEWQFSIKDNGIGIDPQYFERIFVIFQRLHTASQYPGTGIGLAISKRIVERHIGRMWVESEPGNGSTFFFTLPDKLEEE